MTDRRVWESRHEKRPPRAAPSAFVERHARTFDRDASPRALDLACGSGRHTRLLADLGFEVVALDFSRAALLQARSGGRTITAVEADATRLPLAPRSFDLVVQTCFLERAVLGNLLTLLRPGGLLVLETFAVAQFHATGHPRREFCLEPGEIEDLCGATGQDIEIIERETGDRGEPGSPRHLDAIAVRRP